MHHNVIDGSFSAEFYDGGVFHAYKNETMLKL